MLKLSKLTMPIINYYRENLNLTDDELIVFDMLSKNRTRIQIADRLNVSARTVDRKTQMIKEKIKQLERGNTYGPYK